jgi:hypothetical protein
MEKQQQFANKTLLFLYKEMPADESVDFLASLEEDSYAMQEFLEIQATIASIQPILYSPSEKLVSRVQAYASFNLLRPQ